MLIQDVVSKDKKAQLDGRTAFIDQFGILRWEDEGTLVMLVDSACDGWRAYPKEIRPEEGGEVWSDGAIKWITSKFRGSNLKFMSSTGDQEWRMFGCLGWHDTIIHNKNGWKRLFPPVESDKKECAFEHACLDEAEDDNVERIEIENVIWGHLASGHVYPKINNIYDLSLPGRPPMKMILEYKKGPHECQG